jgi:predicted dehydrogenase
VTIGVGIIGYGFMGRAHAAAYARAAAAGEPCEVRAVCDLRGRAGQSAAGSEMSGASLRPAGNRSGNLDVAADDLSPDIAWHNGAGPLFAADDVDLVSVCTPTDTHVAIAEAALRAGKHVLVEKPVALDAQSVRLLAETAREANRLCMPAMCMRFWPGWDWLKFAVDDRRYGAALSAVFQRLGSRPAWAQEFYGDDTRSGGAMFDLHVHDADIIHWLFGRPGAVTCRGDSQHCTTLYEYDDGPRHVSAEAAWDNAPGFGFRMRYTVAFEGATADFDLLRPREHGGPLIISRGAAAEPVALADLTGYDGEIRALLRAIAQGAAEPPTTLDDAASVIDMLCAERDSARERATVVLAR